MNCPLENRDTSDMLIDYASGKLEQEKMEALDRHMETCQPCARVGDAQTCVWSALDQWETGPVSADFDQRLFARIEAAESAPWYRQVLNSLGYLAWRPAVPLAAAAAVIMAGFFLDHPVHNNTGVNPAGIHVSAGEAEQLEQTLDDIQMLRQLDPVPIEKDASPKSM